MAMSQYDTYKSVEQLEGEVWEDSDHPTNLVERTNRYRKIPISDLTIEQLRLLIGQNIGLKYLIPPVIKILRDNILAEGDFYDGDLLSAVLNVGDLFWVENQDLKKEVQLLITEKQKDIEARNEANIKRQLLKEIESFKDK
jgi:hypothetical protein